ncbi:hypothetical protein GCM10009095_25410 [Sphingomonas molluscorum]|nr:hypothetical protein GCM10017606_00580 [Microbacterium terregens]
MVRRICDALFASAEPEPALTLRGIVARVIYGSVLALLAARFFWAYCASLAGL